MKIQQKFVIDRAVPEVWSFFYDVPKVASCLPGAEYLGENDAGKQLGKISAKVGPFQASFEGEAELTYDQVQHQITCTAKGVDKKGASRGKMTMVCLLAPSNDDGTEISVESDVQLSGPIAQFGRTSIFTEVANVFIANFVQNAEIALRSQNDVSAAPGTNDKEAGKALAANEQIPQPSLNVFSILLLAIKGWLFSFFRKSTKS